MTPAIDHRPAPTRATVPLHPLQEILAKRIAIIDGAMGTTIRTYGMTEADIRGERFRDARRTCSTTATSSRSPSRR